ncbi:MAG: twin-arginine translocase TatA/TatE family subunit [Dehalococcoidales bacterium]|jgi:sec-independent protein translocase protein TatA|nr:twin-arginine translocase TatA/TatE family subunit [Dehalococcoidales bacterium]MDP6738314.1 twin-arginine translocase TatA/TatE family subunit [Dehalococcoidales bacterium]|tara:strand:+ start:1110 stop:1328 length:219 start_codon:yes stop_codon:yes gene_type:complete
MPFRLGPWEIGLILIIILIVFGVGKLPQIGSAFGKTIQEFRKASKNPDAEKEESEDKEKVAAKPAVDAAPEE